MSPSGALFDLLKFNDVSKNVLAQMTAKQVYDGVSAWAKEYDPDFYNILSADEEYAIKLFSIGRGGKKPRKDFACYSEVKGFISYFYDELFEVAEQFPENIPSDDLKAILSDYSKCYEVHDDMNAWFEKVKGISEKYGYTSDMKAYKENPETFKGSVTDVSTAIRVAITGKRNSPDLCQICALLGKERVINRLSKACKNI